ncbi:MAG TPA: hypothetical protein VHN17_15350 [Steroidobacteraceae bacterium]|jgi:hypothetical protein|nr:hypothetical protein [Steroidobacteraceae bacterium]
MRTVVVTALAALGVACLAPAARAQQDLEPAVRTSPAAAPVTGTVSAPASAAPPGAAPATTDRSAKPGDTRAAKPAAASAGAPAAVGTPPKGGKSSDRIELDTTQISGNRELPKVMYVVPWRKADPGEFTGRPLNSLLDEALTPVDRDVFRRQNRYYAELSGAPGSDKSQPGAAGDAPVTPTPRDEK